MPISRAAPTVRSTVTLAGNQTDGALAVGSTYFPAIGSSVANANVTERNGICWIAPQAGVVDLLNIVWEGGATIAATVRKGAGAGAAADTTLLIPATAGPGATAIAAVQDTANSFTVAAGDYLTLGVTPTVAGSASIKRATVRFTPS